VQQKRRAVSRASVGLKIGKDYGSQERQWLYGAKDLSSRCQHIQVRAFWCAVEDIRSLLNLARELLLGMVARSRRGRIDGRSGYWRERGK
jgi:hypothetical protein